MDIAQLYQLYLQYPSVQTDTRKLKPRDIFFALKGDNFNGNLFVQQALDAGAYGYLLKDTDKNEFIKALKQIHGGHKYFSGAVSNVLANRLLHAKPATGTPATVKEDPYHLTKREKEILRMVVDGKHNKDIADSLDKSVRTVETHRFNIMKKLDVNNAVDMVNKTVKENLL